MGGNREHLGYASAILVTLKALCTQVNRSSSQTSPLEGVQDVFLAVERQMKLSLPGQKTTWQLLFSSVETSVDETGILLS